MYCIKCGTKLPDEAAFCFHCGQARLVIDQPSASSSLENRSEHPSLTGHRQGQWQYREFSEPLAPYTGGQVFRGDGIPVDGSIPVPEMRAPIGQAVRTLLNRLAADNWEPMEPISPDQLWRNHRVASRNPRGAVGRFLASGFAWELVEVLVNCRRWTTTLDDEPPQSDSWPEAGPWQTCEIRCRQTRRGLFGKELCFVAELADQDSDEIVGMSPPFKHYGPTTKGEQPIPEQDHESLHALDVLVDDLTEDGWEQSSTGPEWFNHRFRRRAR